MFHYLEERPFLFALGVIIFITFAGLVELLPNFANAARPVEGQKPYTVLQLAGRGVYIKESCNACHSQLIRPFKNETNRYGMYSVSGEYAYDRPFLWGSKRTGPDLHRVGMYRTTDWHEYHMKNPSDVVPGSIMPSYKHMFSNTVSKETAYAEAYTVKTVFGVPYDKDGMPPLGTYEEANEQMLKDAKDITDDMKSMEVKAAVESGDIPEIVALIAYLNSLK
jgi:cytochrome c oxidase cbb3-type subunit 2